MQSTATSLILRRGAWLNPKPVRAAADARSLYGLKPLSYTFGGKMSLYEKSDDDNVNWVQACITNVSFPTTLDDVQGMVEKNCYLRDGATDLDTLLEFDPHIGGYFTAPRWLTQGDILFFYHAVSAKQRIANLLKKAKQESNHELTQLLKHAANLANRYAGTIFGYAEVVGPSEYLEDEDDLYHFKSKIFAPIANVHIFDTPLSADRFNDFVKISRQGTITFLGKHEFNGIKKQLSESNELPLFLKYAEFSEFGFRNVNETNWISISCAQNVRFIHETQVRVYLIDFLLNELKDKSTPLLQECRCFRGRQATGIADYFIKLNGCWIPVEAKLNALSERDLLAQVAKYIYIDSFVPTIGLHKGETFAIEDVSICIVIDQSGIYLVVSGEFNECSLGEPKWKREQLESRAILIIRNHLHNLLTKH